jgi:hypothetical protein
MSRFHYSVQLGWQKLDEYYTLTDNSPAYVASICLHPRYKWKWIEEKWAHRMDGIKSGVRRLWEEYKRADLSTDNYLSFQPKRRREATRLDDFVNNDMSDSASNDETIQGEYNKWMNQSRERKGEDPIEYWHSQRYNYPRLACFALDIFGVPAKSSEPERVFSVAGQLIRANRARLKPDIIGAALSLKSWDEMGAINWR